MTRNQLVRRAEELWSADFGKASSHELWLILPSAERDRWIAAAEDERIRYGTSSRGLTLAPDIALEAGDDEGEPVLAFANEKNGDLYAFLPTTSSQDILPQPVSDWREIVGSELNLVDEDVIRVVRAEICRGIRAKGYHVIDCGQYRRLPA